MRKAAAYVKLLIAVMGGGEVITLSDKDLDSIDQLINELKPSKYGPKQNRSHGEILRLRYGLNGEKLSLREIGKRFGVGHETIRNQEYHALLLLRASSKNVNEFFQRNPDLRDYVKKKEKQNEVWELIRELKRKTKEVEEALSRVEMTLCRITSPIEPSIFFTSVDTLDLSTRAENCMRNIDIRTIGDLVLFSEDQLICTKNMGVKTVREIQTELGKLGLRLGMLPTE